MDKHGIPRTKDLIIGKVWGKKWSINDAIREVLDRSIALGGSSLLDYRDAEGNPGTFQQTLRVYDRAGLPCPVCASPIRTRMMGGRSTFWCSPCQP